MEIIYFLPIPMWFIFIVIMFALGAWELLGGIINCLICGVILFMIAVSVTWIIVGILDIFCGKEGNHLIFDGDYWEVLLPALLIALFGGALMYETYFEPYIVKKTNQERIVTEPEKEKQAAGELIRIEGSKRCSAFYAEGQDKNYVRCRGKRGEVTLYAGENYKYFATATKDTGECKVYADDELVTPEYDENIQMSVYKIDNCEELKFKFSGSLTLPEAWVYKTSYPN